MISLDRRDTTLSSHSETLAAPDLRALQPPVQAAEPTPPTFLRLSAGFIYFFFGFLKLFPDLSPAELIAGETLTRVSGHWLSANTALWWLALMECTIGLCFLFNFRLHWCFFVFMFHQASTFLPLFIVPELCFKFAPFAPTMEGQYIFKNLISVAAGYTVMMPMVKARLAARKARRRARVLERALETSAGVALER